MSPAQIAATLDACDDATKIAVTAWVFKHLVEHAQSPGSFRHLVYKRMGFKLPAYTPLLNAGGMTISTLFDMIGKGEPVTDSLRVPVEPTREMWAAAGDAFSKVHRDNDRVPTLHHDAVTEAVWHGFLKGSKRDTQPPIG